MPETRYTEEDEPLVRDRVKDTLTVVIAGQGIVRRVVLYLIAFAMFATDVSANGSVIPITSIVGVVSLAMLMATDKGLA